MTPGPWQGAPTKPVLWGKEEQRSERVLGFRLGRVIRSLGRRDGGLAQLGERLPCKQEVSGSIPLISTTLRKTEGIIVLRTNSSLLEFERRNDDVSELWAYRPKRRIHSPFRRGPIAQLARAHD